ncbi:MAG: endonuclease III [Bacillota bacterium]
MKDTKKRVKQVLDRLQQEYPQAGTRLKWNSVFELLVATILSAQTTDNQVNHITGALFQRYNKPEDFALLTAEQLEPLIKGCGLYRNKARHIIEASRMIMERYAGRVPDTLEELMELPGVGRKTANVILSVGFGKPGLAVDTHVQRVTSRLGFTDSNNPEQTEMQLKSLINPRNWGMAHHLFIWHGRSYCQARKPKCLQCPLAELCPANTGKS